MENPCHCYAPAGTLHTSVLGCEFVEVSRLDIRSLPASQWKQWTQIQLNPEQTSQVCENWTFILETARLLVPGPHCSLGNDVIFRHIAMTTGDMKTVGI